MKKIDFHTHTTSSDGMCSPKELIDYAVSNDIVALAITDHDTVDGIPEAVAYAEKFDLHLIPGIEFSVEYDKGSFHLVGLYIDYTNRDLVDEIKKLTDLRSSRIERMLEDLQRYNINIPVKDVEAESTGGTLGRPHVARAMIKHGYSDDIDGIFKKYLVKGKPGYVGKEKISLDKAVSLITGAGGITIIAHPISLNFTGFSEFDIMLKDYIKRGVVGIEVYSEMHTPGQVEQFYNISEKYNLLMSGGSDYHGDREKEIGYYDKDLTIPIEVYFRLEEYISKKS